MSWWPRQAIWWVRLPPDKTLSAVFGMAAVRSFASCRTSDWIFASTATTSERPSTRSLPPPPRRVLRTFRLYRSFTAARYANLRPHLHATRKPNALRTVASVGSRSFGWLRQRPERPRPNHDHLCDTRAALLHYLCNAGHSVCASQHHDSVSQSVAAKTAESLARQVASACLVRDGGFGPIRPNRTRD